MDSIWESVISINRIKFSCTVIELHRNEQHSAQTCLQPNLKGTQFAVCACTSAPTKRKKSEVTLGYNDAKADQRVSESYSQIN